MSAHYDKIKADVSFRKEVANSYGVGFDVPAVLGSIGKRLNLLNLNSNPTRSLQVVDLFERLAT